MRDKIRIGIIGLGHMGSIHYSKIRNIKNSSVTAVYDTDSGRYRQITDKGVVRCRDYREFVRLVDGVVIASPGITHKKYLKYFLGNNIHCLCEKPPVLRYKDLCEMIRLSQKNRTLFNVVMPERENAVVKYILNESSDRGLVFQSDRVAPFSERSTDISVLYDIMIHDLDIMLGIIPYKIRRICATGLSLLTGRTDILNVRIEYSNGSFAILNASRAAFEKKRKIRVFYKGGYISADLVGKDYRHIVLNGKKVEANSGDFKDRENDPINSIDNDFIDMISGKKRESSFSALSVLRTLKVCNLIENSTVLRKIN